MQAYATIDLEYKFSLLDPLLLMVVVGTGQAKT